MGGAATLSGDASLRSPMSWSADAARAGFTTGTPYRALAANVATQNAVAAMADPNSLLAFYKAMLALRNGLPSIAQGSYEQPFVSGAVMGYQRLFGSERTLVLINYGPTDATVGVSGLNAGAVLQSVYPPGAADLQAAASGVAQVAIASQAVKVFKVLP
jgi:glycosidase